MLYQYDGEEFWLGVQGVGLLEFEVHSVEQDGRSKVAKGKLVFRDHWERINGSDNWIAVNDPDNPETWKVLPDRECDFFVTRDGVQIFTLIGATNKAIEAFANKVLDELAAT